ncbi:hypothetical protein SARC_01174 [Sphaeroforma arctica JP610]|uniref:Uncharacterized protein n=1 Tax=Sphaeroforma arctica JP610 TaxID=667725 RepID=A0A0L0GEN1_9EUKA|nr:hypothetical protein SARC_01174 [Sphaeroforma arctica JP610]KNC86708.1 hypothetical protein SARC_01174 [Sphaeroforma arctica JP610]|eukprot:XP_014160610.1 hypothetical protein SARC_01174 [Sphaeroforma arctica JP610]
MASIFMPLTDSTKEKVPYVIEAIKGVIMLLTPEASHYLHLFVDVWPIDVGSGLFVRIPRQDEPPSKLSQMDITSPSVPNGRTKLILP